MNAHCYNKEYLGIQRTLSQSGAINSMSVSILPHHYQTNICPRSQLSQQRHIPKCWKSRDDRQVKYRPLMCDEPLEYLHEPSTCLSSRSWASLAPFNSLHYFQYAPPGTVFDSKSNLSITIFAYVVLTTSRINIIQVATRQTRFAPLVGYNHSSQFSSGASVDRVDSIDRNRRNGMEPKLRHMDYKVLIARSTALCGSYLGSYSEFWLTASNSLSPDPTLTPSPNSVKPVNPLQKLNRGNFLFSFRWTIEFFYQESKTTKL